MTMQCVIVAKSGAQTCVQDLGRDGWRHIGVGRAGALDPTQAALANRLVGNTSDAAVLEIAMNGPTLELKQPSRIALCGAEIDAHFENSDGYRHAVPLGRAVTLPAGTLRLGAVRNGLRAWLAISGGIAVPQVLGSRSTDLRGGFGGIEGRALRAGDSLPLGAHPVIDAAQLQAPAWWVSLDDAASRRAPIRYLPASLVTVPIGFADQEWRVDPRSDRQGVRCAGEPLTVNQPEQVSAPVAPGTIQLPPDGKPIVLLADAQTVGGYPRLGYVIAADMPRLAQLRAGDALRFEAVAQADAQAAMQRRRNEIARLHWAIDLALAQRTNA
jgi:5-oxoprolinase (ATP-hydrolysing) subunit C